MTCKDCIHIGVCYAVKAVGENQESDKYCMSFKNKADYAEVKHGEWIKLDGEWREQGTNKQLIIRQCSFCGTFYQNAPYIYCPNCGAKMDGERK
jgi:hypothetical protein